MPKLDFDHNKNLIAIKIEKSPKKSMEIFSIKEGDFNFRSEETSENKDTRLS
jgi:hypothetical protein